MLIGIKEYAENLRNSSPKELESIIIELRDSMIGKINIEGASETDLRYVLFWAVKGVILNLVKNDDDDLNNGLKYGESLMKKHSDKMLHDENLKRVLYEMLRD